LFYKCRLPWKVYAHEYRKKVDVYIKANIKNVKRPVKASAKTHRILLKLDDGDKYLLRAEDIPLPQYWYKREKVLPSQSSKARPSRTKVTVKKL
jgi:hypothetical protein